MEFVVYVSFCVTGFAILFAIPAFIWGIHDNKRREREELEQEEAAASAEAQ